MDRKGDAISCIGRQTSEISRPVWSRLGEFWVVHFQNCSYFGSMTSKMLESVARSFRPPQALPGRPQSVSQPAPIRAARPARGDRRSRAPAPRTNRGPLGSRGHVPPVVRIRSIPRIDRLPQSAKLSLDPSGKRLPTPRGNAAAFRRGAWQGPTIGGRSAPAQARPR